MKIIRVIAMFLLGLFTAIFIYPFLHELGHSIATVIAGGKVYEVALFPQPYIVCNVTNISIQKMIFIGFGGMVFPLLFTFAINSKNCWLWLFGMYLNLICLLSFFISLLGCIMYVWGKPIGNEDITQILMYYPEGVWICCFILIVLIVVNLIQIITAKPLHHCNEIREQLGV